MPRFGGGFRQSIARPRNGSNLHALTMGGLVGSICRGVTDYVKVTPRHSSASQTLRCLRTFSCRFAGCRLTTHAADQERAELRISATSTRSRPFVMPKRCPTHARLHLSRVDSGDERGHAWATISLFLPARWRASQRTASSIRQRAGSDSIPFGSTLSWCCLAQVDLGGTEPLVTGVPFDVERLVTPHRP